AVKQIGASMRSGQQCFDLLGVDVFTMPVAAAKEFLQKNPPPAQLKNRTQDDPKVTFAAGVDAKADRLEAFWTVEQAFEQATGKLAAGDPGKMTPGDLLNSLHDLGLGDLFPRFQADEQQRLTKEGKIPVYGSWRDRVRKGTASWDGILTAAALASFAQDQSALDERITRLL